MQRGYLRYLLLLALSTSASARIDEEVEASDESLWAGIVSVGYSTNAFEPSDENHRHDAELGLYISRPLLGHTFSLTASAYQMLNDEREFGVNEARLTMSKKWLDLAEGVSLNYRLRTGIAMGEHRYDKYGSVIGELPLTVSLGTYGFEGWTARYTPRLTRNIYHRKSPVNGGLSYVEYDVLNILSLYKSVTDKLTLIFTGYFRNQKPFENDWRQPKYGLGLDAYYQLNSEFGITTGYSNRGSLYDSERGNEGKFNFYDPQNASFYFIVEKSFDF